MQFRELMAVISTHAIRLQQDDEDLVILGDDEALDDALWDSLAKHKAQLLELVASHGGDWSSPALRITPDMLPLVQLDQPAIDRIVATVPGGVANVQDIYPLAPLQEGMLYLHLAAGEGDLYVQQAQFTFDSHQRLDAFAQALQWVIDRHDILRTSFVWERLDEPVQVVWRQAPLVCEEVQLDTSTDVFSQLQARYDARHLRLDLQQAPLLRLVYARDPAQGRIVALLLFHHMIIDTWRWTWYAGKSRRGCRGRPNRSRRRCRFAITWRERAWRSMSRPTKRSSARCSAISTSQHCRGACRMFRAAGRISKTHSSD